LNAQEIRAGLESFEAVEGRLQLLGEKRGVTIYNDNNATTPEATIAALRALDEGKKNIILIAGGSDKGLTLDELADAMKACRAVVLLEGTGTQRLKPLLPQAETAADMQSAVAQALARAEKGDTLLFSPAFASFGLFKNEYERNDAFVRAVSAL
jgi:UDP-N-acetylmuramoylalanine--D-glutamate ligase